ncbi:MAG: hypothetical protein ACFC03_01760 [Candidatus Malihini olakiniferum]
MLHVHHWKNFVGIARHAFHIIREKSYLPCRPLLNKNRGQREVPSEIVSIHVCESITRWLVNVCKIILL